MSGGVFNGIRPPSSILHAPREPVRFAVPGSETIYILRQPTHMEKARFRGAVTKAGGRNWSALDMLRSLRNEAARILASLPEERRTDPANASVLPELDGHIQHVQERIRVWQESRAPADLDVLVAVLTAGTPRLEAIRSFVQDTSPSYAEKVADTEDYPAIANTVAFKKVVVGWEGLPGVPACETDDQGVHDGLMDLIPSRHVGLVGARARELFDPPEETLKNSDSASSGESSPDSSTSPSTPATPPLMIQSHPDSHPGTSGSLAGQTSDTTPASS